jgi:hypothetical protein
MQRMRRNKSAPDHRRRVIVASIFVAMLVGGGASTAVALSSAESPDPVSSESTLTVSGTGLSPDGESLPVNPTATPTAPVSSGPQVSEAVAVAAATQEARLESTASTPGNADAIQTASSPKAVTHTTRKIATDTIGQGQEPTGASPEIAAWYGGSVYLVAFQGNYVAHDAPVPPGASAPTGSYLTVIVDAYSGKITGYELSRTIDLAPKVAAIAGGS